MLYQVSLPLLFSLLFSDAWQEDFVKELKVFFNQKPH